jgi:hypothetical protein
VLEVNDLGEAVYPTPAIADRRLFGRAEKRLLCFAKPGSRDAGRPFGPDAPSGSPRSLNMTGS